MYLLCHRENEELQLPSSALQWKFIVQVVRIKSVYKHLCFLFSIPFRSSHPHNHHHHHHSPLQRFSATSVPDVFKLVAKAFIPYTNTPTTS